jgi:hypothetical protein
MGRPSRLEPDGSELFLEVLDGPAVPLGLSENGVGRPEGTFGTTIRIAQLHHPSCLTWGTGGLRFL